MAAEPMQVKLDQSDSIHLIPDLEYTEHEKFISQIIISILS